MAEEKKHHLFHHKKEDKKEEETVVRDHTHLEQLTGLGAMAADAYALREKYKAKKDPENAHKHKVKGEIATMVALGLGVGDLAFHDHHKKKDAKKKSQQES